MSESKIEKTPIRGSVMEGQEYFGGGVLDTMLTQQHARERKMHQTFSNQVDSLINSSIGLNNSIGQRKFARRIQLSSLGKGPIPDGLIETCVRECESRGIQCNYNTHMGAFNLQIDIDAVLPTQARSAVSNH